VLTKSIFRRDGQLISDGSACTMGRGMCRRIALDGVHALAALISDLGTNQAIALGAPRPELTEPGVLYIVPQNQLTRMNGAAPLQTIARSADFFGYRAGNPSFCLLDYDRKGMPPSVAARLDEGGGLWPALVGVLPKLKNVARLERASTSSGIFDSLSGEKFPDSGGRHIYLAVKDGADNERFLKVLHQRCWLAGLGWYIVGAAGQLLDRSVIDRMVGRPERLVFEAPPVLQPPLAQDQEARRPIAYEGEILDTVAACPPLGIAETAKIQEMQARAAEHLAPARAKARAAFIERQSQRLADRLEAALARRLDRMTRQIERLEHHVKISNEAIALFVRFWLTSTPPLPDSAQPAAQTKGRERYEGFVEALGRRLARGRTLADELLNLTDITETVSRSDAQPGPDDISH
jgi:hypothetical protein